MDGVSGKNDQGSMEMEALIETNDQSSTEMEAWIVEIDEQLSNKMKVDHEAKPLTNKKIAIYRRPVNVTEEKDRFLYTPRLVSFGPYHHDDKSLEYTNKIKKNVLVDFLNRSNKKLKDCIDALKEVVQDLKDAYDELDPKWQQDGTAFLKMMIYDGCFFLEILHAAKSSDAQDHLIGQYSDRICATYKISPDKIMKWFKHDMLLLENQLPMLLLKKLHDVQKNISAEQPEDLYGLILNFVAPNAKKTMLKEAGAYNPRIADEQSKQEQVYQHIPEEQPTQEPDHQLMCLHVLDLYRYILLHQESNKGSNFIENCFGGNHPYLACPFTIMFPFLILAYVIALVVFVPFVLILVTMIGFPLAVLIACMCLTEPPTDRQLIIPSATELEKAGIRIKMNNTTCLTNIDFTGCILKLPPIYIDGATRSRFLNLIAFEQFHSPDKNPVMSYIYIMSRLLQAAGDARLLQFNCIIDTTLDKDEVVELFKSLTKDIDPKNVLIKGHREVVIQLTKDFYSRMHNAWQKELWQTCFRSPWACISVTTAVLLFALTAIQTVYSALPGQK